MYYTDHLANVQFKFQLVNTDLGFCRERERRYTNCPVTDSALQPNLTVGSVRTHSSKKKRNG